MGGRWEPGGGVLLSQGFSSLGGLGTHCPVSAGTALNSPVDLSPPLHSCGLEGSRGNPVRGPDFGGGVGERGQQVEGRWGEGCGTQ